MTEEDQVVVVSETEVEVVSIGIQGPAGSADAPVLSVNGRQGEVVLHKSDLGLTNVDNTADLDKPASNAVVAAFAELSDVAVTGSYGDLIDRPIIPAAVDITGKVDKEPGKGLSTNDFTDVAMAKLSSVESGATQNASDADLRDRSTHTGTQAISSVSGLQAALESKADVSHIHDDRYFTESEVTSLLAAKQDVDATRGLSSNDFTSEYRTKLDGISPSATANSTDSQLRDRSTHTGVQPMESVTGLTDALAGKAATVHTHVSADVTDLAASLALKAPLVSPTFTGTPAAPTAAAGTNTTQLATMAAIVAERTATKTLTNTTLTSPTISGSGALSTSGAATLTGSLRYGFVSLSSSTTLTTHSNVEVTAAGITITLPTAASVAGREITIINASTGAITVASTGSQTIGNTNSAAMTYSHATGQSITLISNGTNWRLK